MSLFGYRIENGKAVICEKEAEKIRTLYKNYLSGMSLNAAAKAAEIAACHSTIKRMLENKHYLGDAFYPAIVDREIFEKAAKELLHRAEKLGRLNQKKEAAEISIPTSFHFSDATEHYENPKMQAEYLYSLLESEAI